MSQGFPFQNGCIRVFPGSRIISQGVFLLFKIGISGCFPCHSWCPTVFSGSELMSQVAFRADIDVSACVLGQNRSLRVSYISKWMLCISVCFPCQISFSECFMGHNWCLMVFSLLKLMSQGVLLVIHDVSGCFRLRLDASWCLPGLI